MVKKFDTIVKFVPNLVKLFQEKLQYLSRDLLSRERVLSMVHASTFERY